MKNTLAIVHAIVTQSLRSSSDMQQAEAAISSRILALGRVHDLLLRSNWSGARLEHLLRAAIEPFAAPGAEQFIVQTADIEISPSAALPLVMTINELCTNAVKYGALSTPEGRIEITPKITKVKSNCGLHGRRRAGRPFRRLRAEDLECSSSKKA